MRAALVGLALALAMAAPAAAAPRLVKIGDFSQPVHVASPPGDARVFVVEKRGVVRIAGGGTFLDARALVNASGEEQGLLSIAFPPDYAASGLFYVYLTAGDNSLRVVEYRRSADPNRADPASARTVLSIPHPGEQNHNGGQLQFGPDGYLYVGTGDGGGAGDPENDAQTLGNDELGKILRIVAHTGAAAPGNPFGTRIWSYGLRNPWRFTFDRSTHELLIGDVGQDRWEEVDWARGSAPGKGVNFGWHCREGFEAFDGCTVASTDPVFALSHDDGFHAVVGGYVVRDPGLPTLRGRYLYGDTYQPTLYSVALPNSGQRKETALAIQTLSSFGEDACGRIYAASLNGPVYRVQDGAATPCGSPGGQTDTTPPRLKVSILGARKALEKRRLLVRVGCSEACRAAVGTRLIKVKKLRTRTRRLTAGHRVTVKLKLTKKVTKKLRRRVNRKGFVRIGVTVRATDLAGNTAVKHRHGRIRRR